MHFWGNIAFCLCCLYQCLVLSERCCIPCTDGMTQPSKNRLQYAVALPLGIITQDCCSTARNKLHNCLDKADYCHFYNWRKNSTTGADALEKYQLAGILHKFINAQTTHKLLSHPPSECSRMQLCKHRSQAGVNQLGVTTIPACEWDSCRLCHHSSLAQFLRSRRAICSTDRTYKLSGSHVWEVLSSEKSRSPATAIKVSMLVLLSRPAD